MSEIGLVSYHAWINKHHFAWSMFMSHANLPTLCAWPSRPPQVKWSTRLLAWPSSMSDLSTSHGRPQPRMLNFYVTCWAKHLVWVAFCLNGSTTTSHVWPYIACRAEHLACLISMLLSTWAHYMVDHDLTCSTSKLHVEPSTLHGWLFALMDRPPPRMLDRTSHAELSTSHAQPPCRMIDSSTAMLHAYLNTLYGWLFALMGRPPPYMLNLHVAW